MPHFHIRGELHIRNYDSDTITASSESEARRLFVAARKGPYDDEGADVVGVQICEIKQLPEPAHPDSKWKVSHRQHCPGGYIHKTAHLVPASIPGYLKELTARGWEFVGIEELKA